MKCDPEALEELAAGRLDDARAADVALHADHCDACRDELAWLRSERELMQRRASAAPSVNPLWRGIERRLEPRPDRSAVGRVALPIMMMMAAAAAVIVWSARRPPATATVIIDSSPSVSAATIGSGWRRTTDHEYAASLASVVIQLEPPP